MISAVVLAKNEEKNLRRCLNSLLWCDEIIVIDDESTDSTVKIARKCGAKVVKHSLNEDFAGQRNFALNQTQGDWVLFVDADEEVSKNLAEEIKKSILKKNVSGFYLKRRDIFEKKLLKYGETGNFKILRLAMKNSGTWKRSVDEKWEIKGKKEVLKFPLFHYSHPDLNQFLQTINKRSSLNAQLLYKEGRGLNFFEWLKPFAKFVSSYFFMFGFLDKKEGFIFSVLMSFHSYLVRSKLYLLNKK